jgi:hypothetical protein
MVTVFPIAYFGNIEYYRELLNATNPIIEVKEHFIKQTLRTRCEILTANGSLQLSIPVIRHMGSKTPIDEVLISNENDWRKTHWRALESAYSSSPFFDHYSMEIEELIYSQETNLIQFNLDILIRIDRWLSLNLDYKCSDSYISDEILIDHRSNSFTSFKPIKPYRQVFSTNGEFTANLSILDLLFCEGPMARNWLINS